MKEFIISFKKDFLRLGVMRKFPKFSGKHQKRSPFLIKGATLLPPPQEKKKSRASVFQGISSSFSKEVPEAYSKPSRTFKMEVFAKIVNG